MVEVEEDLEDLIPEFLDNRWEDVHAIGAALECEDFDTIQVLGHSMKGSGGGYGFDLITEIGKSLEAAAKGREEHEIRRWLAELEYVLENVEIVFV